MCKETPSKLCYSSLIGGWKLPWSFSNLSIKLTFSVQTVTRSDYGNQQNQVTKLAAKSTAVLQFIAPSGAVELVHTMGLSWSSCKRTRSQTMKGKLWQVPLPGVKYSSWGDKQRIREDWGRWRTSDVGWRQGDSWEWRVQKRSGLLSAACAGTEEEPGSLSYWGLWLMRTASRWNEEDLGWMWKESLVDFLKEVTTTSLQLISTWLKSHVFEAFSHHFARLTS